MLWGFCVLRLDELGVLQPESGMKQHPLHLASCTHEGGVPCRQAAGPHIPSGLSKHKALEFGSGLSLPAGCILPALLAVCSHSRELPAHTLTAPTPTRASEAAKNHDSNGINPAGVQSARSPPDPVGDGEGCGSSGPCSGAGGDSSACRGSPHPPLPAAFAAATVCLPFVLASALFQHHLADLAPRPRGTAKPCGGGAGLSLLLLNKPPCELRGGDKNK